MNEVCAGAAIRGTMEIRDNWFVVRHDTDHRLLMVGPYLPLPARGVYSVIVHAMDVPALLDELRARLNVPPVIVEFKGE